MNEKLSRLGTVAAVGILVVAFQNCSSGSFDSSVGSSQRTNTAAGGGTPPGSPPGAPPVTGNPPGTTPPVLTTPPASTARNCFGTALTNEVYSQPAVTTVPAGISFLSDWTVRPVAGGFGAIQARDTCRYKLDPSFQTWHGKPAVRVEVNPGDTVAGGERSEALFMQTTSRGDLSESSSSGLVYYGMSYYFPPNWAGTYTQGDGNSWSLLFQFHPGNGNGYFAGLQAGLRNAADGQSFYYTGGISQKFTDGSKIRLGEWVDFVWAFNFSTGKVQVYRRNQGQTKFALVLDITDSSMVSTSPSYFKQGLYRGPNVNGRTDVIWIGPTSRGTSFSAVEQASFGTNNGF